MIDVHVNGEARALPEGTSVAGLVALLDLPRDGRGVAVAVDGEVVPRGEWESTSLREDDRVEVLVAVQGG